MAMAKGLTGFLGRGLQRSNYAYANARVRVRRSKLLARDSYAKLLKMEPNEIARFLDGTTYSKEFDELASKFSGVDLLENALEVNLERDFAQIRHFTSGEVGDLVGRYLDRYSYENVKTILRGRSFGADPEMILKELLIQDRADFDFYNGLVHAEGQGMRGVVDALAAASQGQEAARVLSAAEAQSDDEATLLQRYEDALDRHYYVQLLDTIQPTSQENSLFLQFVRKEIDAKNVELLLRFMTHGNTGDAFSVLIDAGYEFRTSDLRRLAEANDVGDLIERLKEFQIYAEAKAELEAHEPGMSLAPVFVALRRTVGDFAQRFSYRNPLSVLPIINYLMRKTLEVRNIRAIARGRAAGLAEDRIESLLVVI